MESSFVPRDAGVPTAVNQSAPLTASFAATAKVSTLLTTVGSLRLPCTTGNGGRLRGTPRLPSSDSMSADSSPQM